MEMLYEDDKDAVLRKFSFERYDRALRKSGWGERFSARLAVAGMGSLSLTLFVLQVAIGIGLVSIILRPLAGTIGTIVIAFFLLGGGKQWIDRRRRARVERFILQVPEWARLLAHRACAGLGMQRSIALAHSGMSERTEEHTSELQ